MPADESCALTRPRGPAKRAAAQEKGKGAHWAPFPLPFR